MYEIAEFLYKIIMTHASLASGDMLLYWSQRQLRSIRQASDTNLAYSEYFLILR